MFGKDTRVLIVDDMSTMRKIIRKHLMEIGITQIQEANDGATAWPKIEQSIAVNMPFGLIISDWNMPEMKGIDLLKKVREATTTSKIPFLLVTAEAELNQISEAIAAGVSDYVVKPFSTDILMNKLTNVWKKTSGK